MPWYLHLLIDDKKTQRHNFFNENTGAKKEQNIPRTLRSYHVSIFIRRPFSNRGKDQRKLKFPLLPDSEDCALNCALLFSNRFSRREKKKEVVVLSSLQGANYRCLEIHKSRQQTRSRQRPVVLFLHPLSRMEYRFLYLQFSPCIKKKWRRTKIDREKYFPI